MVSGAARVIKLSVNLKPFVSRVSRNGRVQQAFAAQIGHPVGQCVRGAVHAGMSGAAIHKAVKDCAKGTAGTRLSLAAAGRAPRIAAEYYEIE
jgi:hypothetical protein